MSDLKMVYIAVDKACGHWVGVCLDNPERAKDVGKLVGEWVKNGLSVDHILLAQYHSKDMQNMCDCKQKNEKRGAL